MTQSCKSTCGLCYNMGANQSVAVSIGASLGEYMSSWVRTQEGKLVESDASNHRQTECWDLAMAAIEHARSAGFVVPNSPSSYVWSSQTVSYQDAELGDILQFASYSEKYTSGGSTSTKYTASRHTAVVTKAFDSSTCGIQVEEQNPNPVHQSVYHPCSQYRTGGSVIVYRLGASSPSPTPSPSPSPSGCVDSPSNWVSGGDSSSDQESCSVYASYNYCTSTGGEGSGWKSSWGKISDWANSDGLSAADACCACGGGRSNGMKTDMVV